jgi:hypothetical protein
MCFRRLICILIITIICKFINSHPEIDSGSNVINIISVEMLKTCAEFISVQVQHGET